MIGFALLVLASASTYFTWTNLGFGKCRLASDNPVGGHSYLPNVGTAHCQDSCGSNPNCGGYSVSIYGNCLLWLNDGLDMMAGGTDYNWGSCSCIVKTFPYSTTERTPTQPPTPSTTPQTTTSTTPQTTTSTTPQTTPTTSVPTTDSVESTDSGEETYQMVKFCTNHYVWVNHIEDNPGEITCQCYPQNDPCLLEDQDGAQCEFFPECGILEESNSVNFLPSSYIEAPLLVTGDEDVLAPDSEPFIENTKSCPDGKVWVNHIYDNPGKTTCECYSEDDPCLAYGCLLYPECSSLEPSSEVVFQGDYLETQEAVAFVMQCPEGESWVNNRYENPGQITCECVSDGLSCIDQNLCFEYPACSTLSPSEGVTFTGYYEIIAVSYPGYSPMNDRQGRDRNRDGSSKTGLIIAIIVLAALLVIVLAAFACYQRKRNSNDVSSQEAILYGEDPAKAIGTPNEGETGEGVPSPPASQFDEPPPAYAGEQIEMNTRGNFEDGEPSVSVKDVNMI